MIDVSGYDDLMKALVKLFGKGLDDAEDSAEQADDKPKAKHSITIVSVGKPKGKEALKIPKAAKPSEKE